MADQETQETTATAEAKPAKVVTTDVDGNPIKIENPQVGRPVSKGDTSAMNTSRTTYSLAQIRRHTGVVVQHANAVVADGTDKQKADVEAAIAQVNEGMAKLEKVVS